MTCEIHADAGPLPVFQGAAAVSGSSASTSPRLLTGSLDGHVKVHELDSFKVTHSAKYPGPVLSVAMSPDANALAVGMANRLLSIRRRIKPRDPNDPIGHGGGGMQRGKKGGGGGRGLRDKRGKAPRRLDAGHYLYFVRGAGAR